MADRVWKYAETALREKESARDLADFAERQGFRVQRGVGGLPTAFVARFGEGRPIIGLLGEYDALPGLSQKAKPNREALAADSADHGCGHNLLGAAALGATIAVKEQIAAGRLKGTVVYYGCPAEETLVGKLYMARAGAFDDLDIALAWHPGTQTAADTEGTRAQIDFRVEFRGRAAHAASNPWAGRSALDALELFTHGLNLMREHVKPSVRMHYVISDGGKVPNIVPDYARLWCWVRDSRWVGAEEVLSRLRKVADGAGLMAEVETQLTVQSGVPEMLVNEAGARVLQANLNRLGPVMFTAEEQQFARELQRACSVEPKGLDGSVQPLRPQPPDPTLGSTDVAAVSWRVPTLNLRVTTVPVGVPGHAWPVVACSGTSMGHRGMIHAAKVLAATTVDLLEDEPSRAAIRAEFDRKARGSTYRLLIPDGPPRLPEP
jgi:aminobenzoyl-glutamate utilization protein B